MFFSKAILLVVAPIAVLATPHALNYHPLHHRAIAARVTLPLQNITSIPLHKRRNTGRCRQRPTSSSVPLAKPSSSAAPPASTHTTTQQQFVPVITSSPPPSHVQPSSSSSSPTTTAQPPSGNDGNQPSYLIGTQIGQGTFYSTGLGACGITNNDNDLIAAVSHLMFDTFPAYNHVNPNTNPICHKRIKVMYQGKSVIVTVTDRCESCKIDDLDLSPAAFNILSSPDVGRLNDVTWVWI